MKRYWISILMFVLTPTCWANKLPLQYAVKFVCGRSNGEVVAPGEYFTAINVHNPSDDQVNRFLKKVAVALPDKETPPTPFVSASLKPDGAIEVDCKEILTIAKKEGFLKGFVVIESKAELDIVGVYTAAGNTQQIETMEIERVPVRRTPVK